MLMSEHMLLLHAVGFTVALCVPRSLKVHRKIVDRSSTARSLPLSFRIDL